MTNRTARLVRFSTTRCTSLPMRASPRPCGSRGLAVLLPRCVFSARVVLGCSRRCMAPLTNCTRRTCPGGPARSPIWSPMLRALRSLLSCFVVCRGLLQAGVESPVSFLRRVWPVWPLQPLPIGDPATGHGVSCLRELCSFLGAVTGVSARRGNRLASLARGLRLVACYEAIPLTGCSSPLRACCLGTRAESKRLGPEPRLGFRAAAVPAWSGRTACDSHFSKRSDRATHSECSQRFAGPNRAHFPASSDLDPAFAKRAREPQWRCARDPKCWPDPQLDPGSLWAWWRPPWPQPRALRDPL